MNKTTLFYALLFIGLLILSVAFLWRYPLILMCVLFGLSFIKHQFIPIAKEALWFCISALLGAGGESLMMLYGPWVYAAAHIGNVPLWLPVAWGLAGCSAISLYEALTAKKK